MKPVQQKKICCKFTHRFQRSINVSRNGASKRFKHSNPSKLVYLYTLGLQYYDFIHKDKFKQFYSDKLVSFLTRKNVENFLDKNPINIEERDDLDLFFPSKEKKE